MKEMYEAPVVQVLEMEVQGVIADSPKPGLGDFDTNNL